MSFVPIQLEKYVELHLKANPCAQRAELVARIEHALEATASAANAVKPFGFSVLPRRVLHGFSLLPPMKQPAWPLKSACRPLSLPWAGAYG